MHQLTRRAAFAVLGTGLGMAAAVTMAAGPGFAQPTPSTASYLINFQDLDAPALPESGDKIDGHGFLSAIADPSQNLGTFTFNCHFLDENSAHCSMEHFLTGQGKLHFTFEAEYDSSTDIFALPERQDADLTEGSGDFVGAYGSGWIANQSGSTYVWNHNLWQELDA